MKTRKTILALVLAVVLVLALVPTAFAAVTISYSLSNVTASGQPVSIDATAALSATLTAADGYRLPDSITVTCSSTSSPVYNYVKGTGVVSAAENAFQDSETITITAAGVKIWKITYDDGTETVAVPSEATVDDTADYTIDSTVPSVTGKNFTGWSDGTTTYQPGAQITNVTAAKVLTAQWEDGATITYNNGGKTTNQFPTPTTEKATNKSYTISSTTPTVADGTATFRKWKDGNGNEYAPGAVMSNVTAATELTAQWTTNYTVTYAGGTAGTIENVPTNSVTTGTTFTIDSTEPTSTGWEFLGWVRSDTSALCQANAALTGINGNLTLTGKWAQKFTITYVVPATPSTNANNTPAAITDTYVGDTASYTTPATPPTLVAENDNAFAGWRASWNNALYGNSAAITLPTAYKADHTLTAEWKAKHALSFIGTGVSEPVQYIVVGEKSTALTKPTNGTDIFGGWKDQNGRIYWDGDTVTMGTTNITLTAQWTAETSAKKIAVSGGYTNAADLPDVSTALGTNFKTPAAPARGETGYVFKGWKANWSNAIYPANATVALPATMTVEPTLTGVWEYVSIPGKVVGGNTGIPGQVVNGSYWVKSTCSLGGTINPDGYTSVKSGSDLTITFKPSKGYSIQAVYVDGVLDNSYGSYVTFKNITKDHSVYVQYTKGATDYDYSPKAGDFSSPLTAVIVLGLGALLAGAYIVLKKKKA